MGTADLGKTILNKEKGLCGAKGLHVEMSFTVF